MTVRFETCARVSEVVASGVWCSASNKNELWRQLRVGLPCLAMLGFGRERSKKSPWAMAPVSLLHRCDQPIVMVVPGIR